MINLKEERFNKLKIGHNVMTRDGFGYVLSFGKNGIGQDGVIVKLNNGDIKGLYTYKDIITSNKYHKSFS
jgi:hypothetical protein